MQRRDKAITANDIQGLLAAHHAQDIYVAECKNGPSWTTLGRGLLVLDGWALKRTWSPLTTIGYEIKVTRSDFEQDQKWPQYLPLVHQFYFVCPAGLIRGVDLPKGVGLKWVSTTGTLHTKIKSERNEPDVALQNLAMLYILMARTVIVSDMTEANNKRLPGGRDRIQELREVVEHAEGRKELAYFVNHHVRERFAEMGKRVELAVDQERRAKRFASMLARLGITWDPARQDWGHQADVENEISQLCTQIIDGPTLGTLQSVSRQLGGFVDMIQKMRDRQNSETRANLLFSQVTDAGGGRERNGVIISGASKST